ncbi:hypothetical protein [Agrococcus jejuensis]|uniref:Uncharacterized protein n=1 Tax=Agrococcus jejuensis TaxID=399736 RepID=A0A1G8CFP3_9MICO|nr:hypothetical protein [Agrococcus jejuensis]SDH44188.1 hypothetical protein SAMN04489720_1273 [Agrococcus jejuensis]
MVVRDGQMVDIVNGDVGCVQARLGEWCEVMLTPALDHDLCLSHRLPAIVPNPPCGDASDPSDLAAWFRAFEFAGVVRRSGAVNRQLRRLAAYGIHSAFRDAYRDQIDHAIADGFRPSAFGTRALSRRAASHALAP